MPEGRVEFYGSEAPTTIQEATPMEANTVINADEVEFETGNLEPAINAIVKETKTGYKTTEFWIALGVSLLTVLDGIPLPEKYEAIVVGAITAVYIISRGVAKQGIPDIESDAPAPLPPA